ncbi:DUF1206 domain-containing protein [Hansschlegelia zhihuaiae]|uniref:DUF1206 domain-containing protein n=1 Tax=Hansschlegelia zhihuaiae TaxID=405005 RepID=A0A4Q0MII5_9HYPH|nr:DUF1206 domain-containing protein [Hansschlegelia zhihuaiae]RXF73457.1 DUF1206 domain-containing protein [Hansschlegelia zhihuaiae]
MSAPRDVRIEHFARAGLAARGAVYLLVGGLALTAAIGAGGDVGGNESALRSLLSQPFGAAIIGAIGLGLVFFAAWRIYSAIVDPDGHGDTAKGLGTRAVHALSGIVNGALALTALTIALGVSAGGGGDDDAAQDWTAFLLSQPFGRWLTAAVGAGVVGAGLFHLWKSWRGDMLKRLSVPAERRSLALIVGRVGYAARGVVFIVIGGFLIAAAIHGDSSEAKGLGGALQALEDQPFGWALLALVAAGLAAFGAFGFLQALWRRIRAPDLSDAKAALDAIARKV